MKCKTVTLRKRKIKNGTQYSLCLDYYPGYRDNATMKVITREALGIYIFAKPANQQ
ncbi:MAG: site-specific integrase, partial [Bacteroidales bacterium]|nr:site-specific integrase [Bacteroidales bacterium]